jgi:hypothetical protein
LIKSTFPNKYPSKIEWNTSMPHFNKNKRTEETCIERTHKERNRKEIEKK